MARKLKILGAALVAVLAMSAVAAQAASAAGELFHSHIEPTVITGHSTTDRFTATGVPTKCTTATLAGTQAAKSASDLVLHPTYSGCSIGVVPVTVTSEGCTYTIGAGTTTNPNEAGKVDAPVTISCTPTKALYLEASGCKVTIETPQTVHGVGFKNTGTWNTLSEGASIKDIDLILTMAKIKYIAENTAVGTKCGTLGIATGTHEDMSYTGESTVKGFVDNGSGTNTCEYHEGEQVGIFWQ